MGALLVGQHPLLRCTLPRPLLVGMRLMLGLVLIRPVLLKDVVDDLAVRIAPAVTAWAEGHFCRWWQYDTYYGGYWIYLDCPAGIGDGRYAGWYSEIP